MRIPTHGIAADNEKATDEAPAVHTKGLNLHIVEDATETNRYGGPTLAKKTPESTPLKGARPVEVGEPIKRVPPNGRTDPL